MSGTWVPSPTWGTTSFVSFVKAVSARTAMTEALIEDLDFVTHLLLDKWDFDHSTIPVPISDEHFDVPPWDFGVGYQLVDMYVF